MTVIIIIFMKAKLLHFALKTSGFIDNYEFEIVFCEYEPFDCEFELFFCEIVNGTC